MSRICLVGVGAPSFIASRAHEGPGLRCGHFAHALARAGHELLVVYRGLDRPPVAAGRGGFAASRHVLGAGGPWVECVEATEKEFGDARLGAMIERFAPEAIVAAGAHAAALALRFELDVPLWADVFGDLMAEAQAKALVSGSDGAIARFWSVLQPVLERADRFSAVSRPQADALIGQLGVFGRLGGATAGERMVSIVPCAAEAAAGTGDERDSLRPEIVPAGSFVVLWSGSFNTWCDADTAVAGLAAAMKEDAAIHFVATGGCVRGHDERTLPHFRELARASGLGERFHFLGRVERQRLARYYADADVGICVERDLYERRFGSENRVVEWAANGLPCVTTALSELGRCLAARELCFACPPGDAAALARLLVGLAGDRERVETTGRRCRGFANEHLGFDVTARALVEWAATPVKAGDCARVRPLSVGLVSEPRAMVGLLEAYLAELGLGQIAYRSSRWLWRRVTGRAGNGGRS